MHLVFVPQLLVELPHLIRFQVEDTEDRLHPVLDGYALLLGDRIFILKIRYFCADLLLKYIFLRCVTV